MTVINRLANADYAKGTTASGTVSAQGKNALNAAKLPFLMGYARTIMDNMSRSTANFPANQFRIDSGEKSIKRDQSLPITLPSDLAGSGPTNHHRGAMESFT